MKRFNVYKKEVVGPAHGMNIGSDFVGSTVTTSESKAVSNILYRISQRCDRSYTLRNNYSFTGVDGFTHTIIYYAEEA